MPTSKLTLVCTDNVFTTSKSNTNILSFKFVQRRVSSVRKSLMDARRNSNDAICQVLWSTESLQQNVRHCVSQMHKEYLQKNPIHVFDLQEDSTRLLTIPSWSVYARQVGMHYQWSFGIDDVDCYNTYHILVYQSHMTSYYLLTRHNHPYEWQWQWIDSKLVLQD